MNTKENLHTGHRERFRIQLLNTAVYNISDIHFLEYLLGFSIPRADTNPIAHSLINKYKTIDRIFEATIDSLIEVDGIGPKTARFLKAMPLCAYMYNKSKALSKPKIDNLKSASTFLKGILPSVQNEQFVAVIMTKDYTVKDFKIFAGINDSYIDIDSSELNNFLIKQKAAYCIFAHTHPCSSCNPSIADIEAFKNQKDLLKTLGIGFFDNLILGNDGYYSFAKNAIIKYNEDFYD